MCYCNWSLVNRRNIIINKDTFVNTKDLNISFIYLHAYDMHGVCIWYRLDW